MLSDDASGVSLPVPRWRVYIWGVPALLTCPCHLPLFAAMLAGTSVGAFVGDHLGVAALARAGLFVHSVTRVLRVFSKRE
jgi:mercuric ion transport protein